MFLFKGMFIQNSNSIFIYLNGKHVSHNLNEESYIDYDTKEKLNTTESLAAAKFIINKLKNLNEVYLNTNNQVLNKLNLGI